MFIQEKKKEEQRIGYKEKEKLLEDFYKGKNLARKVLLNFQELSLNEFVIMSSLHL